VAAPCADVYGFALTVMNLPVETTAEAEEMTQDLLGRLPVNEFPNYAEFITEHDLKPGYDHEGQFAYGLDVIVDGLEDADHDRDSRHTGGHRAPGAKRGGPTRRCR
jgi:hypothetical protein